MELGKRLLRAAATRRVLSWLVYLHMRVVYATTRWTVIGEDHPIGIAKAGRPTIAAFWHGRMLMLPLELRRLIRREGMRHLKVHMLISGHGDGRAISDVIRYTDIRTVEGSTNQGGSRALRALVQYLRAGEYVGITPDGPNGPAMRATAGVITIARLGNAPIMPYTYATSRRRILDSWDRFHVPLPFGRGVFIWGEPIHIPADLSEAESEAWRALLEERLNALTAEADRRVGHEAVAPGTLTRREWNLRRRAARAGGNA
ncbi:MAG TPA: lysophospholipid acyltransferase family protein [Stellaceae bacterium]|nr:lysophospholipid acyltransferase family protein [Stellaceae bacterium]